MTNSDWKKEWEKRPIEIIDETELNRGSRIDDEKIISYTVEELLKFIDPKKEDVLLDAGCGSGENIILLSKMVKKVVGVDFSEGMVNRATKKIKEHEIENAECYVGDVTDLKFEDGSFDKVICISVLQYLDDKSCEKALSELIRVAKKDGYVLLYVKNSFSFYSFSNHLIHTLRIGKLLRKIGIIKDYKSPEDYHRSYSWYIRKIESFGGEIIEISSFNVFPKYIPSTILVPLLRFEMKMRNNAFLSKLIRNIGVNYRIKLVKQ